MGTEPTRTEGHVLAIATAGALISLLPVAAHQVGWIGHLPDPAGSVFDSDGITESRAAHPLGVPDGLLGLGSYGITMALVIASRRKPTARKALGLKLAADGAAAGFNVERQLVSFRKICSWCTATALCTAVMVVAGRQLIGGVGSE
jgi:uncharacterized membrane protein